MAKIVTPTTYTDAQMLAMVRARIYGQMSDSDAQRYTVGNRSFDRYRLPELLELEKFYSAKVASAAGTRGALVVRFREPTASK